MMRAVGITDGARRVSWVPVLVGAVSGGAAGAISLLGRSPDVNVEALLIEGIVGVVGGVVLGVVAMLVSLMFLRIFGRSPLGIALAFGASVGIGAVLAMILTWGYYLAPMMIVTALSAGTFFVSAALADRKSNTTRTPAARDASRTGLRRFALTLLISGVLVTLVFTTSAAGLLRNQLLVGCTYGTMGEAAGSWSCGDGIGLIFPGLSLALPVGLTLLAAALVVFADGRFTTRILRALTPLPVVGVAALTVAMTLPRTDPLPFTPSGMMTWPTIWWDALGPATTAATLGAVIAGIGVGRVRNVWWTAATGGGVALLVTGVVFQVGLLAAVAGSALLLASIQILGERPRQHHDDPRDDAPRFQGPARDEWDTVTSA